MLVATGKKLANMKEIRGSGRFDTNTGCTNTLSTRIFGKARDHLFHKKYTEYGFHHSPPKTAFSLYRQTSGGTLQRM